MLKLQLREIGETLSGDIQPDLMSGSSDERHDWHDSSLELERGLEVVELSVDLLLGDLDALTAP